MQKKKGMIVWYPPCYIDKWRHYLSFWGLKAPMIPKAIRHKFKTEWRPIMRKMERADGLSRPDNLSEINSAAIEEKIVLATNNLKTKMFSLLWEKPNEIIENWYVAIWIVYT